MTASSQHITQVRVTPMPDPAVFAPDVNGCTLILREGLVRDSVAVILQDVLEQATRPEAAPAATITGRGACNRIINAALDAVDAAREHDLHRSGAYRRFHDTVVETLEALGVPWE